MREGIGQTARIDSLYQLIQKSEGIKKVDALNEYAAQIFSYDYLKAKHFTQEAFHQGEQLKYKKGMAQALIYEGIIESSIGHDTLSLNFFYKSLQLCQEANELQMEGNVRIYIGQIYQNFERLDSTEVSYQKANQILKDSVNPLYLSYLYLNLAKFYQVKNPALQLPYLLKSWKIRQKLKEKRPFVWIGIQLTSYYTEQGNYTESLSYLDKIQKSLGKDTVDNEEINIIYRERASVLTKQGKYLAALDLFAKAKKFYDRNTYPLELTNLYIEMGNSLAEVSSYETSLKYFLKALGLAQANHYARETARLYYHIAWIYFELNQYTLSNEYCAKAMTITKSHHYESEESSTLNLLGLLAQRANKTEEALHYFNEALVLRIKNNYRDMEASTLSNMAILFLNQNAFNKAEELELKSLAINEELKLPFGICESYKNLGQLYTQRNDFKKASFYLTKAETLAKSIHAANFLSMIYHGQREFSRKQRNYLEADRYSILHETLKDSLFNQRLTDRVSTMQYDFELDQKDKEIKILSQQKELQQNKLELQQAQIKQQRFAIAIGLFIFFNICIGAYIAFRVYRKVKILNHEVSEQNEEITTQSEELRESNEVLSKLNRDIYEQKEEIQAQAEELTESNRTIAEVNESLEEKIKIRTSELKEAYTELDTFFYRSSHDFRRPLTTFMGLAEVAKITVKDAAALELFEKVNETARSLDKMLLKLQSISVAGSQELIYSEVMMDHIFQIELDNFSDEIIQKSIQVVTEVKLNQLFYSYPALVKFIVQNLLENAIAFCTTESPVVWMKAYEEANQVVIEVTDNGQGINLAYLPRVYEMYFRTNERSKGNGLGLYIVKKMVDKLNGRIELRSEIGLGTTVQVFLPNQFNQ